MDTLAATMRTARRSMRLTQQQLAVRLGVDRSVYAMYERGKLVPAPNLLDAFCACCALSRDKLQTLASEADA